MFWLEIYLRHVWRNGNSTENDSSPPLRIRHFWIWSSNIHFRTYTNYWIYGN